MREDSSTVEAGAEGLVLDGVWLRRERERIAIGRRQVAVRLGLQESRVIRVEMHRLPVPADWLAALAALGFLVPPEVVPVATGAETAGPADPANPPAPEAQPSADPPPVAGEPKVPVTVSPAVSAPPSQLLTKAALPSLTALDAVPESVAEPIAAVPEPAASPSTPIIEPVPAPIAAPVPAPITEPVPAPIAEPVPAPIAEPVPAPIVPSATEESAMAAEPPMAPRAEPLSAPNPAPIDAGTIYTGHWLRRERKKRGMMHIAIAPALPVTAAELASAEAQDSPLPLHWLPSLRRLGLPVSEAAAALAAQSTPSPQVTSPPASKPTANAQRLAKAQHPASAAATADSRPESNLPTGAWLRQHRLQRNIMQRDLSARLKTNPSELCRYEMEDRPLRPDWLPILRELGFPLPTAANDRSPPRGPASVKESEKPPAQSTTREMASTTIDGRWLKSERTRLGLSLHAVRLHLHVSAKTYARFEASRGLVPRFWWPGLRQIGIRLPAAPPALPSKPTPHRGPLNGAWLVRERKRLRLTQYEVCRVLQANHRMVHRIERDAAELPKAWLAKLPLLGIAVDAAAQRSLAPSTSQRTKSAPKTPPPGQQPAGTANPVAPETIKPASSAPAARQGADLVALIVNFRLTLGQHTKQPPFEILSRILSDLHEAGADQALNHEDVERAARAMIPKWSAG